MQLKVTKVPKKKEIVRNWRIVDAKGKVLGRIATAIANALRGKDKVIFTPHLDCGDGVIVINAKHVVLTGEKMKKKEYFRASRYFGHLKIKTAKKVMEERPENLIYEAVKGMIPRNKLRKEMLTRLKIYQEEKHPHEAQKVIPLISKN